MESPNDPIIREAIYSNFTSLFQENPNIPIALLIEPLFKLIPTQVGALYKVKTFDFDFFYFISKHPKLTMIQALQLAQVLGRFCVYDQAYTQAATIALSHLINRFANSTPG
jgi:hypothetical protein